MTDSSYRKEPRHRGCPAHARVLPSDGLPLRPSPDIASWREEAAATPLTFADGHAGLFVSRHAIARDLLSDPRFSQQPQRLPAGAHEQEESPSDVVDDLGAKAVRIANLLGMDEPHHARYRRLITSRFSLKAARARRDTVRSVVVEQSDRLRRHGGPADLTEQYAERISLRVHAAVLGIPPGLVERYGELFLHPAGLQDRFDFLRDVVDHCRDHPGADTISDLLAAGLDDAEVQGLSLLLMSSGLDSVAYMIATSTVALLTHPDQMDLLRARPDLMPSAIEEFMRYGTMFLTLFPRTATETVELHDVTIHEGQTVAVSPVAANRDPRAFDDPDRFDVGRDALGHLGFGHGPHGCVGQQLARVEIDEAITHLLQDFPGLSLVHADQALPMPLAHPVGTYRAGSVVVTWSDGRASSAPS